MQVRQGDSLAAMHVEGLHREDAKARRNAMPSGFQGFTVRCAVGSGIGIESVVSGPTS
jgi:hypothetical protein